MIETMPEGFHTLTPTLVLNNASEAIKLYIQIFAAKEEYCMIHPRNGRVVHACLLFGDSKLFLRDVMDVCEEVSSQARFYIYADDVDAVCKLAVKNGLEQIVMPPEDMFWGDWLGMVRDKYDVSWIVATHENKVSAADMEIGRQKLLHDLSS